MICTEWISTTYNNINNIQVINPLSALITNPVYCQIGVSLIPIESAHPHIQIIVDNTAEPINNPLQNDLFLPFFLIFLWIPTTTDAKSPLIRNDIDNITP